MYTRTLSAVTLQSPYELQISSIRQASTPAGKSATNTQETTSDLCAVRMFACGVNGGKSEGC